MVTRLERKGPTMTSAKGVTSSESENFPDVIELNVGGKLFTTCLSTLRMDENSMLAAMFSGRIPSSKDPHGRYFIDRDGDAFRHVLDFLRCRKLPKDSEAVEALEEAEFYQVEGLEVWCRSRPAVLARSIELSARETCPGYAELRDSIMEVAGGVTRSTLCGQMSLDKARCHLENLLKPGARALFSMVSICYVPEDATKCTRNHRSHRAPAKADSAGPPETKCLGDLQVDHDLELDRSHRPNLLMSSTARGNLLHVMFSLIERELAESELRVFAPWEAPWAQNGLKALTAAKCRQCEREMSVDWVRVEWWGSA